MSPKIKIPDKGMLLKNDAAPQNGSIPDIYPPHRLLSLTSVPLPITSVTATRDLPSPFFGIPS